MVRWLENDEEIAIFPALRINLSNQRGTWHEIESQPIHFQYGESFYDFFKFKFLDYNQLILYRFKKTCIWYSLETVNTFQLRRGIHSRVRCRCWSKGFKFLFIHVNINSFHNYFNKYHFKRYNVSIWCKYLKFYIMDLIANSRKS